MDKSKNSDHIQIMIKMQDSSKEPPASSKAPNQDWEDMNVLRTFKIEVRSRNSENWYIKDQWPYLKQDQDAKPQSGTSSVLQISK